MGGPDGEDRAEETEVVNKSVMSRVVKVTGSQHNSWSLNIKFISRM